MLNKIKNRFILTPLLLFAILSCNNQIDRDNDNIIDDITDKITEDIIDDDGNTVVEEPAEPIEPIYTINNNTITITGFSRFEAHMVVPKEINGVPVTKLGWPSFHDNRVIKTVTLPEGLIEFDGGVFEGSSLESINIPESVTTLGIGTFAGSNLKALILNRTLENIPQGCFESCPIESLYIPSNIKSIGLNSFSKSKISNIEFEVGIEKIEGGAFSNNKIKEIVLPTGLTFIGESAFEGNNFEKITINEDIKTISDNAFFLTNNDIELFIPNNYNNISDLKRIFNTEPLTINSVSKPKLYSDVEVQTFNNWIGIKINEINIRGSYTIQQSPTPYKLSLTILTVDTIHEYNVVKEGNLFKFKELLNGTQIKTDSNASLDALLEDK